MTVALDDDECRNVHLCTCVRTLQFWIVARTMSSGEGKDVNIYLRKTSGVVFDSFDSPSKIRCPPPRLYLIETNTINGFKLTSIDWWAYYLYIYMYRWKVPLIPKQRRKYIIIKEKRGKTVNAEPPCNRLPQVLCLHSLDTFLFIPQRTVYI